MTVLDTTYPHDKPQMLYWNVASEFSGEARVEITYFTTGRVGDDGVLRGGGYRTEQIR